MKDNLNFEETIKELEKIVSELENNDCPLETAIELFSNGVDKIKKCNEIINNAKLKIETIENEQKSENE